MGEHEAELTDSGAVTALGIDVGGTSIKSGVVDLRTGDLIGSRVTEPTPEPASPDAVRDVLSRALVAADWEGPVGCAFPGVVRGERMREAYNLTQEWTGLDLRALVDQVHPGTAIVNDADAAGRAEVRLGAAVGVDGTVIVLTFGTGIGSAMIHAGRLIPDTEFGELRTSGFTNSFEEIAAARNVHDEELEPDEWASRAHPFLANIVKVFNPEMIVIGGGLVDRFDEFFEPLDLDTRLEAAHFSVDAGIVGAALSTGPDRVEEPS